jgi:DNA-binding PadR family transcriptional regulator
MLQEFFRGFIKIHILHHAEEAPVYGLEMAVELAHHGYDNLSPGTLYPTLHALERSGYLTSQRKLDRGRWRRYYALTSKGKETLRQVRIRLRELAEEVLEREVWGDTDDHDQKRTRGSALVARIASQYLGHKPDEFLHGHLQ